MALNSLTCYRYQIYMSSNVDFRPQCGRKKVVPPIKNLLMARCIGLLRPARSGRVARRGGKTILARRTFWGQANLMDLLGRLPFP